VTQPLTARDVQAAVLSAAAQDCRSASRRPAMDAGPVGHRQTPFSVIADAAADHARLRQVKAAYDPEDVFRPNHTIEPA
jgi:Berberine and berberine like